MSKDDYIEIHRTFYELPRSAASDDDVDTREAFLRLRGEKGNDWNSLLKEYRVIILAEAGAGKTREIEQAARKVRSEGKQAFFVRLEHVAEDLEDAFEVGTPEEFEAWLSSTEEGWLFLDSIDESRLKDPTDFKKAIRRISTKLKTAMQRSHIVITGRPHAWRPKTDLDFCEEKLPFAPALMRGSARQDEDGEDNGNGAAFGEGDVESVQQISNSNPEERNPIFKVYSLFNLSSEQVETFVQGKGVADSREFLKEVERRGARSFTSRPQDLEETVDFWNKHGKLGSPLELMSYSIERRLTERDQDRADANPLPIDRAREGARRVAAAAILSHESTIRVPDGASSATGIDIKSVLTDWDDQKLTALLSRPIFDEAIYGAVRFHHRTVREYLAAEWFAEVLKKSGSRRRVESLFFREQYGMQVITPSMKPVLAWLVLLDDRVREKVLKIEPEVILEGGDPSQLPLPTRKKVLDSVCKKLALNTSSRSVTDYESVQRFASPDMADDIKRLIKEYVDDNEIIWFLLRMVWMGRIKEALPEAKSFALDPKTDRYSRRIAIRAVQEIGSDRDYVDILESFSLEPGPHERSILADLISGLGITGESVDWVLKVIPKSKDRERYNTEGLGDALTQFANQLDPDNAAKLLDGLVVLLNEEPVIEKRYCEISKRFGWLIGCCAELAEKLIKARHDAALGDSVLSTLIKIPAFQQYRDFEYDAKKNEFATLVSLWPQLNHLLFWKSVEEVRRSLHDKEKGRVTGYWQTFSLGGSYWGFNAEHFDLVVNDISERGFLDDRLVALSLAFEIYKSNGRPRKWRERLKRLAAREEELKEALATMLRPPAKSSESKNWKKREAKWEKRRQAREEKDQKNRADWKKYLSENLEELRDGLAGNLARSQRYLLERMRENSRSSRWTDGNWRGLTKEFNDDIVNAFREGVLKYWRLYKPILLSEGAEDGKTPYGAIFGLTGLAVEAGETPDWPKKLQPEEVDLACRYAFDELNGFPHWFPKLYEAFPDIVSAFVLKEMEWELDTPTVQADRHYIIGKIGWGHEWIWDGIASQLFDKVKNELKNPSPLKGVLNIIQGSSVVSDQDLAKLASEKCKSPDPSDHIEKWFPVWIGVDPEAAIKALSDHLENIKDAAAATNLAMEVIVNLVGDRRSSSYVRGAYKTPEHLKELYLLMHKYVREEDDIDRSNTGVYTPELRDDAQDARRRLFSVLSDIKGKEAFSAMVELSKSHPVESSRAGMMRSAKKRAEDDADVRALSEKQFVQFSKELEFTPTNHKELYELALIRFFDLKDDLEEGDSSISDILSDVKEEIKIRKYIGNWCRDRATGKYSIPQEEELADAKRPDIRFHGAGFDEPVPVELKLADNWSGTALFERLENQLCGDYLRDERSGRGVFLLVYRGHRKSWQLPGGRQRVKFEELVSALQEHWNEISNRYPNIERISVIGIDLTKRMNRVVTVKPKSKRGARKAINKNGSS